MPLDFGFYFLYSNRRSVRKACIVLIAVLFFSKLVKSHFPGRGGDLDRRTTFSKRQIWWFMPTNCPFLHGANGY